MKPRSAVGNLVTIPLDFAGRKIPFQFPNSGNMAQHLETVLSGKDYPLPPLPPGYAISTIVDVGANVGAAALRFLVSAPQARVVCFEPSRQNAACLKHNLQSFAKAEVYACGLYSEDRQADLHLGANQCMQHSIVASLETGADVESISLKRASTEFDRLGLSEISILKVDTEGCEVEILEDLGERIQKVDILFFEWHSDADRRRIDALVAEHFLLTHVVALDPHRGNVCYLARRLANRIPAIDAMRIGRA